MKRHGIVLGALLVPQLASAAFAEGHPTTLGNRDIDFGYEWVAASRVLTADGFVKSTGVHDRLREGLEWQLQRSAVDHGLENGDVPSTDQWCAPDVMELGSYPETEHDGRFISVLLLSEVAVAATLNEAIPGFLTNGNPGLLFELSDIVPLHQRARTVGYIVVPVDRLVVHSRVFCAVNPSDIVWGGTAQPEVGDRVVVLGNWPAEDVVRVKQWWTHGGTLAQVRDQGTLQWDVTVTSGGPTTLTGLQARADEAVAGGLFDMTRHLVSQEFGSPDRREFVETWRAYESNGCRIAAVAERPGEGLVPSRFVCPRTDQK